MVGLVCASVGLAHAGELPGMVRDARTGQPIAGAMILTGSDVIVGDDFGRFAIADTTRFVIVQAAGYAEKTLELSAVQIQSMAALEIVLEPTVADEVIEMVGEAPDLGAAPSHGLDADELRSMPGAMGDALRAVQALPEVARVPFSLGGLAVRGMSPRDTDAYLDGIPVPNAFHAGGVAAVIPSATIDGLELVPGAVDARYGGMLGGVVLLESRAPRADRYRARGEVSPLDVQVGAEGPIATGAIAIGVRRSHLDDVVAPFLSEDTLVPTYYDAQLQWRGEVGKGELSLVGLLANSALVIEAGELGTETLRAAARWRRTSGAWTATALAYTGYDRLGIHAEEPIPPYNRTDLQVEDTVRGVRGEVVRDATWGHVAAGVDVESSQLGPGRIELENVGAALGQVGLWAEHRLLLGDGRLAIKTGVRADRYSTGGVITPFALAPRLHITEVAHPRVRVRAALAVERRPLGNGSRAVVAYAHMARIELPPLPEPRSLHAQLALDLDLADGLTVSPGVFAISAHDVELPQTVVQRTPAGDPVISPFGAVARELMAEALGTELDMADDRQVAYGRGRSRGVDVVARLDRGRWNGLLSYTFSTTERRSSLRYDEKPQWKAYILDQPHNLSAALSARLGWWRLGGRVRYVSGGPMPYQGFLLPDRLPAYMDLSLRVERGWRRGWGEVHAFVDVQNATNRKNIEDIVSMSSGPREITGLPFLPFVGLEYRPPAAK